MKSKQMNAMINLMEFLSDETKEMYSYHEDEITVNYKKSRFNKYIEGDIGEYLTKEEWIEQMFEGTGITVDFSYGIDCWMTIHFNYKEN